MSVIVKKNAKKNKINKYTQMWYYLLNNVQATISALWLAENMSINPKLVNTAIALHTNDITEI